MQYLLYRGGKSPIIINGKGIAGVVEENFDIIATAAQIGNAAGYEVKTMSCAWEPGVLGGKGGFVLSIVADGLPLAHRPEEQLPGKCTTVIISGRKETRAVSWAARDGKLVAKKA